MASKQRPARLSQRLLRTNGSLVPREHAGSESSEASDEEAVILNNRNIEDEVDVSDCSSIISISPELENLNILEDLSDHENFPLTPLLQAVQNTNDSNIPTLNSIPSLSSVDIRTPETNENVTPVNTRKRKQKTPRVVAKKIKKVKKYTLCYNWKKTKFLHSAMIESDKDDNFIPVEPEQYAPLHLFYQFFSPDLISEVVLQTNQYSVKETGKSIVLSTDEFLDFLAIQILMGIVPMPAYTDYWSHKLRFPMIADLMPLKRYQQIRRYLHFVDSNLDDGDRYFKVRPIVESVRQNCLKIKEEQKYSIDEMMIPYKGCKAGNRRQYIQNKPTKWGFKNFVRAGASGLIYDFILYGGEDTFRGYTFSQEEASLGLGSLVVLALCKTLRQKPSIIHCDNFFTSPELVYHLRENCGIFCTGTIRSNRLRGCEKLLKSDKVLKKEPRGSFSQVVCNKNKLAVIKWNDNKCVTLISSCVDAHPIETIKRYSKPQKRKIDVNCPQIVKQYNKSMGGVDLADMLISLYRIPFKTRRWYMAIFAQLIDISLNNAWLLYRRETGNTRKSLKEFRFDIYESLLKKGRKARDGKSGHDDIDGVEEQQKIKNPVKARPEMLVRYDQFDHFPDSCSYGRCRYCKSGKTNVKCIKCDIRLCFVAGKRNCFLGFHKQKS